MRIKFMPQLGYLLTDFLQLNARIRGARKMPQFFDIFLQPVDLALSGALRDRFFRLVGHHITTSIDSAPHNSWIAVTSSELRCTRSRNSSVATAPSGAD